MIFKRRRWHYGFSIALHFCIFAVVASKPIFKLYAQSSSAERTPSLIVPQSDIKSASSSVIDVHTHFFVKGKHDPELTKYPNRFAIFANIDFRGKGSEDEPASWACNQPSFVFDTVETLRAEFKKGRICGLKFFKDFGLRWRNGDGSLIQIDDPRWDPIWDTCGELGIPVLMHTADPSAFFRTADETNERIVELRSRPEWAFVGPEFPSRESLHQARNRVIARHPKTLFIAAHFGNDAENLSELAKWLDEFPNLMIEFSSRINELGRQPYSAKNFFEKYQDRILLGTDGPFPEERLRIYWRFLETFDEYFHYSEKSPPPQGDWRIYGIGLHGDILRKIYSENACRVIPGLASKLRAFDASQGCESIGN